MTLTMILKNLRGLREPLSHDGDIFTTRHETSSFFSFSSLFLFLPALPSLSFSLALSHLVIPRNSIVLNYCCITDSLCIVCFCLCLYQIPFNLIPLELFGILPLSSNDSQFVASSSFRYFVN